MGMFDYVNYRADCKNCGVELSDFQSKDADCLLDTIDPNKVDYFYTICDNCKTWHNFEVTRECSCIVKHIEVTTRN